MIFTGKVILLHAKGIFSKKNQKYLAVAATRAVADFPTAWPADAASSEFDLSLISSRTSSIVRRAMAVDDDDDDDDDEKSSTDLNKWKR